MVRQGTTRQEKYSVALEVGGVTMDGEVNIGELVILFILGLREDSKSSIS